MWYLALPKARHFTRTRLEQATNGLNGGIYTNYHAKGDQDVIESLLSARPRTGFEMQHGGIDEAQRNTGVKGISTGTGIRAGKVLTTQMSQ